MCKEPSHMQEDLDNQSVVQKGKKDMALLEK